jgi:hypothetical protein
MKKFVLYITLLIMLAACDNTNTSPKPDEALKTYMSLLSEYKLGSLKTHTCNGLQESLAEFTDIGDEANISLDISKLSYIVKSVNDQSAILQMVGNMEFQNGDMVTTIS